MTDDIKRFESESLSCDIVRDLLPLYHDGVVSDATKAAVEHHLSTCAECRAENETYNTTLPAEQDVEIATAEEFAKTVKKSKRRAKKIAVISAVVAVSIILVVGAAFYLTQVPTVDNYDGYNLLAIYRFETDRGTCFYVAHEQPSYLFTASCIYVSEDNYSAGFEVYDEYSGVTRTEGIVWELNEYCRCPIVTFPDTDSAPWAGGNIRFVEQDVDKVTFNGEVVWTEEDNSDDTVPGYVYEQYELFYGNDIYFDVYPEWFYEDGVWYIKFEYPNGTVKIWDLDGKLVTDQFSAK